MNYFWLGFQKRAASLPPLPKDGPQIESGKDSSLYSERPDQGGLSDPVLATYEVPGLFRPNYASGGPNQSGGALNPGTRTPKGSPEVSNYYQDFDKQAALKEEVKLQPHQERVKKKLNKSHGILVYHGLGSGKSLTSLAATQGTTPDVIVPASLRQNYQKEIKKHTTGHKARVMSYEQAMKNLPKGDTLVVDEAHNLGEITSKRTRSILERAQHYKNRMLLTGTPIRNRPSELGPLLSMARGDTKVPVDPKKFNETFVEEVRHNPSLWARAFHHAKPGYSYRMKNKKQFSDLVQGYVDYHKPNSKDFPSVSNEVIETPMDPEQLKYYKFMMGKAGPALSWKIKRGLPPSKTEATKLNSFLSGMRQVANSPSIFGSKSEGTKIHKATDELMKMRSKMPHFKALVYSNYLGSGVEPYSRELSKRGVSNAIFDGSLSDKKRKELVENYNEGKIQVLLVSGAGSQGLDLKGTKLVQLMEAHWNNPRLEQATGRAIRLGSHAHLPEEERHVHVQQFHSTVPPSFVQRLTGGKDVSVDQYLAMLSKEKENLNNQFLQVLQQAGSK